MYILLKIILLKIPLFFTMYFLKRDIKRICFLTQLPFLVQMSIVWDLMWDSTICGCFHSGEQILQMALVRGDPGRVIDVLSLELGSFPRHLHIIEKKISVMLQKLAWHVLYHFQFGKILCVHYVAVTIEFSLRICSYEFSCAKYL